jgi:hypothetical protein
VAWSRGELILRREIVLGRPWLVVPVFVVEDTDELLVTYLPEGAPLGYVDGDWPTHNGLHPWHPKPAWEGHGALMVQRPRDDYAVWHFWNGPDRTFARWYVNLQEAFRRTPVGYDTQDLELDILVAPDGTWEFKDWDLVDQRVAEGRFTADVADGIRAEGIRIAAHLDDGDHWWDHEWSRWRPDPGWINPSLPAGWDASF